MGRRDFCRQESYDQFRAKTQQWPLGSFHDNYAENLIANSTKTKCSKCQKTAWSAKKCFGNAKSPFKPTQQPLTFTSGFLYKAFLTDCVRRCGKGASRNSPLPSQERLRRALPFRWNVMRGVRGPADWYGRMNFASATERHGCKNISLWCVCVGVDVTARQAFRLT